MPLQLLSLGALSMISRWMLPPLLTSCGRTDVVFRWSLANVILLVVSFPIAVHWGINAVAATVGLVALATAVPQSVHVCRVLRMSLRDYVCRTDRSSPAASSSQERGGQWRRCSSAATRGPPPCWDRDTRRGRHLLRRRSDSCGRRSRSKLGPCSSSLTLGGCAGHLVRTSSPTGSGPPTSRHPTPVDDRTNHGPARRRVVSSAAMRRSAHATTHVSMRS